MKNYLLPILIIILGLGISGFVFFGSSGSSQPNSNVGSNSQTANISKENLRKLTLNIDGMFCVGCSRSIESAVSSMAGVPKADVKLREDSGQVIYDSSKVSKKEIVNHSIFSTYPAEIVSDKKFKGSLGSANSQKIPTEVRSSLNKLARKIKRSKKRLTQTQFSRIDTAISQKNWQKVKNLVDKYINQLN